MSNIISDLAAKCGISPEQAQQGLGAILAFIKKNLSTELAAKIDSAIPEASKMMALADSSEATSSGGVLGAISEMAGKLFGGNGAEVLSQLSKVGFSPDQLQSFIPTVIEFLQSHLPPEVMKQVTRLLPTPEAVEH